MSTELSSSVNITSRPFEGIITLQSEPGEWAIHPSMQHLRTNVDRRCAQAGICSHDLGHSLRATQNGLSLLTMLQQSPLVQMVKDITPEDIGFVMQTHDLGYGSDRVEIIEFQHVDLHERESWRIVSEAVQQLPKRHPTRRYIRKHHDLLQTGIVGTEKDPTEIMQNAKDHSTQNNLFLLLIAAAGKADYFTRQRVDLLPPPTDYTTNPYHKLAFAVDAYNLTYDAQNKTLTYSVQLAKDNAVIEDPKEWLQLVRQEYPGVLELLKTTAQLSGCTFVVEVSD